MMNTNETFKMSSLLKAAGLLCLVVFGVGCTPQTQVIIVKSCCVSDLESGDATGMADYEYLHTRYRAPFFGGPKPVETKHRFDLMIDGPGFFAVVLPKGINGGVGYTRLGNFTLNSEGEMVLNHDIAGRLLPEISVPEDASELIITPEGLVLVLEPNGMEQVEIGQIQVYRFINPEGLVDRGGQVYVASESSGDPIQGTPGGSEGSGIIRQGFLDGVYYSKQKKQ